MAMAPGSRLGQRAIADALAAVGLAWGSWCAAGAVLAGLLATTAVAGTVTQFRDTGPDANRVVVVVVGDGYTLAEEALFALDAELAVENLLSASPWLEYRDVINAHRDFVPSVDSGVDRPGPCFDPPVLKDTAFNGRFCRFGTRASQVSVDDAIVYAEIDAALPQWDALILLLNDPDEFGANATGGTLVVSTHPSAMADVLVHEAGHSFALLADEYVIAGRGAFPGSEPPEPNVTTITDRSLVKWAPWIDADTELPTPASQFDVVGLFEGARLYETGVFRAEHDCKMRSSGRPFGAICKEAHVQQFYRSLSPIDDALPPAGPVQVDPCAYFAVSIEVLRPQPQSIVATWSLDGADLGLNGLAARLDPLTLFAGSEIEVVASDETDLVRRRYRSTMRDSRRWALQRASPPLDADGDGVDDACPVDADGDGIANGDDNCPLDPNASQDDLDSDDVGDACDDGDLDGLVDADDNCPVDVNPSQDDLDGDGEGDACDDDIDGDGVPNEDDCAARDPAATVAPPEVAWLRMVWGRVGADPAPFVLWQDLLVDDGLSGSYGVSTGRLSDLWRDSSLDAACAFDPGDLTFQPDTRPVAGPLPDGHWYLVRAITDCEGELGSSSPAALDVRGHSRWSDLPPCP